MLDNVPIVPLALIVVVDIPVAPPIFNVPNVCPLPPLNVLAVVVVSVKLIVELAPLNVNPVVAEKLQTVPVPLKLIVEVPSVIVLVAELLEPN